MLLALLRRRGEIAVEEPDDPIADTPSGVSTWLNLHSTERKRIREIIGLDAHTSTVIDDLKTGDYTLLDAQGKTRLRDAIFAKWNDGSKSPETAFDYTSIYQFMLTDYSDIINNAQRVISNNAIGLHTNYDTSNGLGAAIDNFETAPKKSDGSSTIYDKEPRFIDSRSGGNDRGSWYANDAAFLYMLAGRDDQTINGLRGSDLVKGIHYHLQEYSNKNGTHGIWLDPFNKARFPRGSGNFRDLNPGFFYAVWLNGLLTSYDYTSNSAIWSASLKNQIDSWFMEWANVFYDNIIYNMRGKWGTNWVNDDITTAVGGSWNNRVLGTLWDGRRIGDGDGTTPAKYGFQEIYANRQVVIMSFVMRCGLFYKDHPQHGTRAREYIRLSKQFAKETIAYAYSPNGSNIDQARTDKFARFMQTPIHYAGVALGALTQLVDAYERKYRREDDYENMWEFDVKENFSKYSQNGAVWLNQVTPNKKTTIGSVTQEYLFYYRGVYKRTRKKTMGGVTEPIDGWSGARRNLCRTQYDRWAARQSAYYALNTSFKRTANITTQARTFPIYPDSMADRVGSAQVRVGWNFFTSCWLEVGGLYEMPEYNFYAQTF